MADYDIQCKHSLFIISTLYFGFFYKGDGHGFIYSKKVIK